MKIFYLCLIFNDKELFQPRTFHVAIKYLWKSSQSEDLLYNFKIARPKATKLHTIMYSSFPTSEHYSLT